MNDAELALDALLTELGLPECEHDEAAMLDARAAIETLRRERDEARRKFRSRDLACNAVLDDLTAANARIATLRERLGFYASGGYGRTHAQMGIQADDALDAQPPETK